MINTAMSRVIRRAANATQKARVATRDLFAVDQFPGNGPTPVETYIWGANSDRPVTTNWSGERAYLQGMEVNHWVYRCARFLADTLSHVPLEARVRVDEKEWKTRTDLPLHQLVNRPNFKMSRQFMIENVVLGLGMSGNGLWWKIRPRGLGNRGSKPNPPIALWPVKSDMIKPVPNRNAWVDQYEFTGGTNFGKRLPAEDVFHVMFQNPNNPWWGVGPLQPVARVVDADTEAMRWWKQSMTRRAVKDAILSTKEPIGTDQWKEYRDAIEKQIVGSNNAHGLVLIGDDISYHELSRSAAELDFVESRRMTREDIAAAFGIPPMLVHILDRSTYSNFDNGLEHYWINTGVPMLWIIESYLNQSITPEFGDPEEMSLHFNLSKIPALRRDLNKRMEIVNTLWPKGVPMKTLNTWLDLDLPEYEGWEKSYVATGVIESSGFDEEMNREIVEGELVDQEDPDVSATLRQIEEETQKRRSKPWESKLLSACGVEHF